MKKYILLGYSALMLVLTTALLVMLLPYLYCIENIIIFCAFGILGYTGSVVSFMGYRSYKSLNKGKNSINLRKNISLNDMPQEIREQFD